MGLTKVTLDLAERRTPQLSDLGTGALYLNYLIAEIIFGFMLTIGLVLFIVPGIIVAVVFGFYSYVIVDRGAGPIEALSRSARMPKGVRIDIFIFRAANHRHQHPGRRCGPYHRPADQRPRLDGRWGIRLPSA